MSLDTEPLSFHGDRFVIATTNAGKVRELSEIFSAMPVALVGLEGFVGIQTPVESGTTFEENARIKASGYATQIGEWVIADDSGLEIDFLSGGPGVHSARFGGDMTSYADKMRMVLDQLSGARGDKRNARFVSVIAMAKPSGAIALIARGECRGTIAEEARGMNGFGYDPIFIPDGSRRTFGEMSDEEKRSLSHRARAANDLISKILDFTGV